MLLQLKLCITAFVCHPCTDFHMLILANGRLSDKNKNVVRVTFTRINEGKMFPFNIGLKMVWQVIWCHTYCAGNGNVLHFFVCVEWLCFQHIHFGNSPLIACHVIQAVSFQEYGWLFNYQFYFEVLGKLWSTKWNRLNFNNISSVRMFIYH